MGSDRADRAADCVRLGAARLRAGDVRGAVRAFEGALAIDPRDVEAARRLVVALELDGARDDAVGAWCCLGAALASADRFEEAAVAYREALARKPDCLRALVRLGHLYGGLARPQEAIGCYERALAIDPQHARARRGLGWAYLSLGAFARGWAEVALDRSEVEGRQRDFEQPAWDGSAAMDETILVWTDQGLGDVIQFLRYLRYVKARCRRLVVECSRPLLPLLDSLSFVDRTIVCHAALPGFDRQVTFHGLGRIFETHGMTGADMVPYLGTVGTAAAAGPERMARSRGLEVGLVWAGEPTRKDGRLRFVPLSAFAPLATVRGVRMTSLQLGPPLTELESPPSNLHLNLVLTDTSSLLETSALVQSLDLVVTVDTMMAHLAGALGRPVWLLLPFAAEWRWEVSGETSRWYPTMRLFRQRRRGEWSAVIEDVVAALRTVMADAPHRAALAV